jgi:hypothetical protein
VADAQLDANRLAAGQAAQFLDEFQQPTGVEKDECTAGEMQSTPIGMPRVAAISGVILAAGSTPPWPGLAPCDSFTRSS